MGHASACPPRGAPGHFFTAPGERLTRWRRPLTAALAMLLSFGTLREWAWLTYQPLMHSYWYWRARGLEPPPRVAVDLRPFYRDLARDRATRFYRPSPADQRNPHKYNAEKLVPGLPVERMLIPERELLRHPRQDWFW